MLHSKLENSKLGWSKLWKGKDINGLVEVLQVPVNGAQAVPQFISGPVNLLLGGAAGVLQQLAPSLVQTLGCVHSLLHLSGHSHIDTQVRRLV